MHHSSLFYYLHYLCLMPMVGICKQGGFRGVFGLELSYLNAWSVLLRPSNDQISHFTHNETKSLLGSMPRKGVEPLDRAFKHSEGQHCLEGARPTLDRPVRVQGWSWGIEGVPRSSAGSALTFVSFLGKPSRHASQSKDRSGTQEECWGLGGVPSMSTEEQYRRVVLRW